MSYKLLLIIALVLSLKCSSQFNSKLLIGKWKLISGKNSDTSITYQPSDQYYVEFFSQGTYRETHKRNEEWAKGKWIKGTWYTVGKWKLVDSAITMYDRRPKPPLKNTTYRDYTDTIISLTVSEIYIISQLNGAGEGAEGTLFYKKIL